MRALTMKPIYSIFIFVASATAAAQQTTCESVQLLHGVETRCQTQQEHGSSGIDFGAIQRGRQRAHEENMQDQLYRQQMELQRLQILEQRRRLEQQDLQTRTISNTNVGEIAPGILRDSQGTVWYVANHTERRPHSTRANVVTCYYKANATGYEFSINRWSDDPCPSFAHVDPLEGDVRATRAGNRDLPLHD